MTIDYIARQQASDLQNSILLFAPAGSGKTSELVKRKLATLLTVDEPEAVLSITFTNKAANELRDRVLRALKNAASKSYEPLKHEQVSHQIAQQVLKRDSDRQWFLLKNPNRLEIRTIDGLCNSIVRQFPLGSAIGAKTSVATNSIPLYEEAVDSFLLDYKRDESWSEGVRSILMHLDNKFDKAKSLLIQMLTQRDQWLPVLNELTHTEDMRGRIEDHNLRIINVLCQPLLSLLKPIESSLISIAHYAAVNIDPDKFEYIAKLYKVDNIPDRINCVNDIAAVRGFVELLFTQGSTPATRKTVSKANGFPAPSSLKDAELKRDAQQMKSLAKDVLDCIGGQLSSDDICAIASVEDYRLKDKEWALLKLCFESLPILASKLLLTFKTHNQVDFIEMAGAAQVALGNELEPTPAALKLDKKYRHILVDEFQDTNMLQLTLLKKLTSGWEPQDGRTLFLVGDPMQSIYMFRGSNISLFMLVSQYGINHIKPKLLHLNANFRSQSTLIEWLNSSIKSAFSDRQNIDTGAMPYNESVPINKPLTGNPVSVSYFQSGQYKKKEAEHIVSQISEIELRDPAASIAILGRSRGDLSAIVDEMKLRDIGHKAVNIHKLQFASSVMDLTALTRAICHIADKQAWVAFIRSPLIGLSIEEILIVAGTLDGSVKRRDVMLNRMKQTMNDNRLAQQTRDRLKFAYTILKQSIDKLERRTLTDIVKGAYVSLGGLSTITNQNDLANIDSFFSMLTKFSYTTFSVENLEQEISLLYSKDEPVSTNVQMMTIHQGKGLEFDYVFIPSCHKGTRQDDKRLLEMEVMYDEDGNQCSTIVPSPETGVISPCMYNTIRSFRKIKQNQEAIRIAYVALTRAKKKLFLSGAVNPDKGVEQFSYQSIFHSVKSGLPAIDQVMHVSEANCEPSTSTTHKMLSAIPNTVFPQGQILAAYRGLSNVNNPVLPKLQWTKDYRQKCGIAIHRIMEEIVENGLSSFKASPLESRRQKFATILKSQGLDSRLLVNGVQFIERHINNVLNEKFSDWLFLERDSSEYEKQMIRLHGRKLQKRIIDYTFIHNNSRYIIDYKSTEPEHNEPHQEFIIRMLETHSQQLQQYENCLQHEAIPIKTGLVLTAIGKLVFTDEYLTKSLVA